MIHTRSLDDLSIQNSWLTIGIFDGVHRGHCKILEPLVSRAHEAGEPAVVITFAPHPALVLGGMKDFKYLTIPGELHSLLESIGVDIVITLPFSHEFAKQTAEEFIRIVVNRLHPRCIFVGYDTALGRGREGNALRLTEIGLKLGFTVISTPPLSDETGILSSTRIRHSINRGDVTLAAEALGRYYDISGPVIHGDGRGHSINIPTANIQVSIEKLIPANGIYACWAWIEETRQGSGEVITLSKKFPAATNVGLRPTFTPNLSSPIIEAHLLDFNQDLYDQRVKLEFVKYLRPEVKFSSIEALVEQIRADITLTRKILLSE
jgi:riboflavin kinase/FMN adenylyltransferase